jgi:hypothetical protein
VVDLVQLSVAITAWMEYTGDGVPNVEAWHQVERTPSDALAVPRVERIRREMARIQRSGVRVKLRPWR